MTNPSPPANTDNQVSCQVLGVFLGVCDEHNISDDVLKASHYERDYLANPANFIEWNSLANMVDRMAEHFTEAELLEVSALSYRQPRFAFYRLMGRLRFTLPQFMVFLCGPEGAVPTYYPITSELLNYDTDKRNLTFRLTLNDGLRPCPNFFKIIQGQFIGLPEIMGYPRADVSANHEANRMTVSMNLPVESGLVPFLRKIIMFPFDLWNSAKTLQLTHDTLVKRNRELEEETRKLTEAKSFLRVQKEQLNLLDQNQAMLFWTFDLTLEPLYYSESVRDLMGYTPEEAMVLPALGMIHEDYREEVFVTLAKYLEMESVEPFTGSVSIRVKQLRKDKTTFWSENYASFLRDNNGKAIGVIGVTIDIDDVVQIENRQKALEGDLQEARQRELVGRVAGGVAHDFNNSLQSIIGFSELLVSDAESGELDTDKVVENGQHILKSATNASELVRQLLALGRRQTLTLETFDINEWIENQSPLIHTILDSSIKLTIDIPYSLAIEGDRSQLERVIANLTLNAKDAMPTGGQFRITARQQEDQVELVFADTGMGIPESIMPLIFEPFFTSKAMEQGSGLGLAMSAGIIEQHKGEIAAESKEGFGTSIRILFPLARNELLSDTNISQPPPEIAGHFTVLVVDDRTVIRELVISMSKGQTLSFIEAKDGEEAIRKYKQYQSEIDLVLMDIVMPKLNGDAAAAQIRSLDEHVPILFMTGYAGDLTDLSAIQKEAVLAKPFNRQSLLGAIANNLRQTKGATQDTEQTSGKRS